jgi:hypothetical protein
MVFNTTFNNISVISWQSVLLLEETGGPANKGSNLGYMIPSSLHEKPGITPKTGFQIRNKNIAQNTPVSVREM